MSDVMCVYCEGIYTDSTAVCPSCNEYDGLMPLTKAAAYLGLDLEEYL